MAAQQQQSTSRDDPSSPRASESPAPESPQGDLELELMGLANAVYNLGTTVVNDLTKEKDKPGGGKQVGLRVNNVINHLANIDNLSQQITTMVPMQVLAEIDNSRNPGTLTRDRLERAATENQFMNGKIQAISAYRSYFDEALVQYFPELESYLNGTAPEVQHSAPATTSEDGLNGAAQQSFVPNHLQGTSLVTGLLLLNITIFTDRHREELVQTIIDDVDRVIKSENGVEAGRLTNEDAAQALLAVKSLGKMPSGSKVIGREANLATLLAISKVLDSDTVASSEALRCVANCMLLVEEARIVFVSKAVGGGQAMVSLLEFAFNLLLHYPKIVDVPESEKEDKGKGKSKESKEGDAADKVMGDCWSDKLDGMLPPLLRLLNTLPPTFPAPLAVPLTHVIHALITVPVTSSLKSVWFPVLSNPASPHGSASSKTSSPASSPRSTGNELQQGSTQNTSPPHKDAKMGAFDRALSKFAVSRRSPSPTNPQDTLLRAYDLLDVTLSHYMPGDIEADDLSVRELCKTETDSALDDIMCPLVLLITKLCNSGEASRKRMRAWILPEDLDRTSPLETRPDFLGRCIRLLFCVHHPRLKDATGEMLYAVCDSDANVLMSYVGYGNVAGFLFNKGILSAPPAGSASAAPHITPSGAEIDPITGTVKTEKPSIEMTEEEKEAEAEKLFVLFDRLERSGALPPNQNPMRKAIAEGKLG
ncbi:hypothetical protein EUX98_g2027 [Antrodiella citrinella]|uniref:Uncharacterized protein n=1 Tax=Antrodiella citrinella TaxID=2447956 RepID=A0A4S4N003_9APHY|nr:hypothetical protein EUX98_g2027 [Antrodiella citrinella]